MADLAFDADVHVDLLEWFNRPDASQHQVVLGIVLALTAVFMLILFPSNLVSCLQKIAPF